MIRDDEGVKISAKGLAQDILANCLSEQVERWMESHPRVIADMTQRELDLLNDQVRKLLRRVSRVLDADVVIDGTD